MATVQITRFTGTAFITQDMEEVSRWYQAGKTQYSPEENSTTANKMDPSQRLNPSPPLLRKRASTQALREDKEPKKRERSDQTEEELSLREVLDKMRRKGPNYIQKRPRQVCRSYCCRCKESTRNNGECNMYGHELIACVECVYETTKKREDAKLKKSGETEQGIEQRM
ncbi:hypothetical protein CIRG_09895 [Coccidioides immitis RMSCC 2394]|uniref:Uncharacterized protein n=1 Tax=Coccidioides immitis RMSCC 2394 TaxID=404692 RepID=A0A0J6YSE4_COCIT|nr:hypothetical protein CIRG_09895 [Coccidioides immitis RMSCC 2394]